MTPTVVEAVNEALIVPSVDQTYAEAHDRRLLIVDDEEIVCSLFAQCLNERYSCETAANAQEAYSHQGPRRARRTERLKDEVQDSDRR